MDESQERAGYVDNMVREFSKLDPAHADDYRTNGENYKKQLQQVQDELVRDVSVLPENQRALVTCEGAFSYLAADAGLKEKYIWAVNSEQQATPSQLSSTIDFVRENQVPAVFCESTVSDDPCARSWMRPVPNSAVCFMSIPFLRRMVRFLPILI